MCTSAARRRRRYRVEMFIENMVVTSALNGVKIKKEPTAQFRFHTQWRIIKILRLVVSVMRVFWCVPAFVLEKISSNNVFRTAAQMHVELNIENA